MFRILFLIGFVMNIKNVQSQKVNDGNFFEININLGTFIAQASPAALEFVQPFSTQIEFSKGFQVSKTSKQWLQAGIGMQAFSAVTDYFFVQGLSNVVFEPLPEIFNYNNYRQTQLQLPILFKQVLFNKGDNGVSLNVGVVPGYIISSNNRLRGNGETVNVKQMTDNRFHWSGRIEFSTINLKTNESSFIFGAGLQYQFSEFLKSQQSFKPLMLYFKVGISL